MVYVSFSGFQRPPHTWENCEKFEFYHNKQLIFDNFKVFVFNPKLAYIDAAKLANFYQVNVELSVTWLIVLTEIQGR